MFKMLEPRYIAVTCKCGFVVPIGAQEAAGITFAVDNKVRRLVHGRPNIMGADAMHILQEMSPSGRWMSAYVQQSNADGSLDYDAPPNWVKLDGLVMDGRGTLIVTHNSAPLEIPKREGAAV